MNAQEKYQKIFDEIHAALCANGCNNDVANFLADLAIRVRTLEDATYLKVTMEAAGDAKWGA